MKTKTKEKIRAVCLPIFRRASLGQFSEGQINKMVGWYVAFLDKVFSFVSSITLSVIMLWFVPVYLGFGWDFTIGALLVGIVLMLRKGVVIKFKDE